MIATGALSGLGAGALLWVLRVVQGVAWPDADRFIAAVETASPLHRVLVPATAGGALDHRVPLAPTDGRARDRAVLEAIWHRDSQLRL